MEAFGAFRITREIATSGSATVYAAVPEQSDDESVALKVLHPHFLQEPKVAQAFVREGELIAKLTHPGLIHGDGVVNDDTGETTRLGIVMELIQGVSLKEQIVELPPPAKASVSLVVRLADALHYLHAQQEVVHCDITPANILVGPGGQLKIVDFGSFTDVGQAQDTVAGTPGYMSPEQARGETLDPRSDLFSLGVVMWELLMGKRLFDWGSPPANLHAAATELAPTLPDELSEFSPLLEGLLNKRVGQRPKGAGEVADQLRSGAKRLGWMN